ncbi:PREDICTED: E3 ubiquitin/ISG15 ligase TRIM25-like isoform X1 [Cyprinodon variegatus]|uniref:E3 ubiquitin/ISG15 ligase TRIM25-like n=1 Tax=Cyprinodon variegatus TaxID=28743 RepID=A0A3Q2E5R8_CYPVA|nr:PREDICTED: E3 ubiquitin/ISG15 ligase TRIM25-like isoform X1 [Cyprinodon variegatus]
MSIPSKPSLQNDPKQLETQEGDLWPKEANSKEKQGKDSPKMSQTARTVINPLTLIKEDFNQLKEEVKKLFTDKDSEPKASQTAERTNNPLTLLKEDLNSLKEELSNVFKIGPSRDRENKNGTEKEDSRSETSMKASRAERTEEPLKSFFGREKPLHKAAQRNHMEEHRNSKADLEINFTKTKTDTETDEKFNSTANGLKTPEVSQLTSYNTEKTSAPAPQCEAMFASKTATVSSAAPEKDKTNLWKDSLSPVPPAEEVKSLEKALASDITLFPLRTHLSTEPTEDLWSLKNCAIYLTFDPNTANSELRLTDQNRKATRDWLTHLSVDHPERFDECPQLLCREGLLDTAYWEVLWSGGVDIGVTYNNISRDSVSCLLGHNEQSWSLECSDGFYTPCHNNKRFRSSSPQPFTNRVGVYLNYPAGELSFFCISRDTMIHLHTFTSTFTEPLYPGFWVWADNGSVTLCQVELGWERLL